MLEYTVISDWKRNEGLRWNWEKKENVSHSLICVWMTGPALQFSQKVLYIFKKRSVLFFIFLWQAFFFLSSSLNYIFEKKEMWFALFKKTVCFDMFSHFSSCVLNFISLCCFQIPRVTNFCQWLPWRPFIGGRRRRNTSLDFSSPVVFHVVLFHAALNDFLLCLVSPRHTNKHVTLTLTQTLSFSSCSVMLEKFSLTRWIVGESPLDAGLRGGEDFNCCDITQIGGDRHADVNWDCVSYVSSAAVCSCVDHSAACSCTRSHKHTTLLSLRGDDVLI